MDAAVVRSGEVKLEVCDDPLPAAGEIRVRVLGSGVCDTDERLRGMGVFPDGTIPGHSVAGQVDSIGSAVTGFRKGDMVVLHFVAGCGRCVRCEEGADNQCLEAQILGFTRPGGIAQYVCAPASTAFVFPGRLSPAEAALLPCGYGTPLRGLRVADVGKGDRVLLLGCRLWSFAAVEMCGILGATTTLTDDDPERLEHAASAGAERVCKWPDVEGAPFDAVVDFTGEPAWIQQSIGWLRPGGRLSIVGRAGSSGPLQLELAAIVQAQTKVAGAFLVRRGDMEELVRWFIEGRIVPRKLLSHRATLYELDDAFRMVREMNPTSVVLDV